MWTWLDVCKVWMWLDACRVNSTWFMWHDSGLTHSVLKRSLTHAVWMWHDVPPHGMGWGYTGFCSRMASSLRRCTDKTDSYETDRAWYCEAAHCLAGPCHAVGCAVGTLDGSVGWPNLDWIFQDYFQKTTGDVILIFFFAVVCDKNAHVFHFHVFLTWWKTSNVMDECNAVTERTIVMLCCAWSSIMQLHELFLPLGYRVCNWLLFTISLWCFCVFMYLMHLACVCMCYLCFWVLYLFTFECQILDHTCGSQCDLGCVFSAQMRGGELTATMYLWLFCLCFGQQR